MSQQRTQEKRAAGATKSDKATVKGKIVEFTWYMKRQGYAEGTIKNRTKLLKRMVRLGANLWDPEQVKEVIAAQYNWSEGYKALAVYTYSTFLQMEGTKWKQPRYRRPDSVPFVPLESELDQLISACGKKISIFLQGLKETGADPGELLAVRWIDINKQASTLTFNHPVKGHRARILAISKELIGRLELLPKKAERIFPMTMGSMWVNFRRQRKRIARKLQHSKTSQDHIHNVPTLEGYNRVSPHEGHPIRETATRIQDPEQHNDLHRHRESHLRTRKRRRVHR